MDIVCILEMYSGGETGYLASIHIDGYFLIYLYTASHSCNKKERKKKTNSNLTYQYKFNTVRKDHFSQQLWPSDPSSPFFYHYQILQQSNEQLILYKHNLENNLKRSFLYYPNNIHHIKN